MNLSTVSLLLNTFFILQFLAIFAGVSATATKIFIAVLAFTLMFLSISQKKTFVQWSRKDLHANGFFFLLYYALTLTMGFLYGFNSKYVLINVLGLAPLFIFLFLPMKVNAKKVLDVILLYSFVSAVLGLLEVFFWKDIPFIKHYVEMSVTMKSDHSLNSNLFKGDSLRAFGMFANAMQNGIFMVMGVGIVLFRLRDGKKIHYWIMLLVYLIAIYFTYTRNVYFSLGAMVLFFILVTFTNKRTLTWLWLLTVTLYVGVIGYSIYHTLRIGTFNGDSIMSRVISWGTILKYYILSGHSIFHVIFGYGITQLSGDYAPASRFWAIDNSLLLVFLGSGLAGVMLFVAWVVHAASYIARQLLNSIDREEIQKKQITIVFLFVYLLSGAMNANTFNIQVLLPLLFLFSSSFRFRNKILDLYN